MCVRAARPPGRARCGAGPGCSAIKYQSDGVKGLRFGEGDGSGLRFFFSGSRVRRYRV
jgi:hypothetical protein